MKKGYEEGIATNGLQWIKIPMNSFCGSRRQDGMAKPDQAGGLAVIHFRKE
ncbi:MAG: hypothetical protein ACP5T8_01905 [Acidithiobacillus sp.]